MKDLSFKKLRKLNIKRCKAHFHPVNDWSETDYGCALAGEVGELCNFLKKRLRVTYSSKNTIKYKKVNLPHRKDCEKEIGDIITYTDLLAARMGIDLGEAVRKKFNEVSDRVNSKIKL